ncbi:MAG: sulfatase-like hydrolase/transferase, partial [Planctomycetaceae bacterium]
MISPYADPQYQPQTYYYTDAITDHAIGFVRQHTQQHPQQPFFLYVAWTAAHWPMHALPEDIARYRGHYDQGYQPVREARFRRAAELGLIDPAQPMAPGFGDWNTMPNKAWESACMEVYAAMVDRMDQGIGRLMHELQQTGQAEQTLVFYLQDNGGCAETMGRTGNRQHPDIPRPAQPTLPVMKPEEFAAGGSTPAQTRDGFPVRMGKQVMPG